MIEIDKEKLAALEGVDVADCEVEAAPAEAAPAPAYVSRRRHYDFSQTPPRLPEGLRIYAGGCAGISVRDKRKL